MAYNVQRALASGLSEKEIRAYLASSGRSAQEIESIIGPSTELKKDVARDKPKESDGMDLVRAITRNYGEGLTFGLQKKIVPRVAAAVKAPFSEKTYGEILPQEQAEYSKESERLKGLYPKISSIAEIASYFGPRAPAGAVVKGAEKLASKAIGSGLKRQVVSGAGSGAAIGGVQGATGEDGVLRGAAKGAAFGGGAGLAVSGLSKAGKGLVELAKRTEKSIVKPGIKAELEKGFDIDNVFKYKVGGKLEETVNKIESKFESADKELEKLYSGKKSRPVDLMRAIRNVETRLSKEKPIDMEEKLSALKYWEEKLWARSNMGMMKPVDAWKLKREIGKFTKDIWKYGQPNQQAMDQKAVGGLLNLELKTQLDKVGGPRSVELNRMFHDLIPIQTEAAKQAVVQGRRLPIGLYDALSLASAGTGAVFGGDSAGDRTQAALAMGIPLALLGRAQRSGRVVQGAYGLGKGIEKLTLKDLLLTGGK